MHLYSAAATASLAQDFGDMLASIDTSEDVDNNVVLHGNDDAGADGFCSTTEGTMFKLY